jgi:dTDP-4-amino-4,6-dideoxygalactose transaminase
MRASAVVPFLDVAGINAPLAGEYELAMKKVIAHGGFVGGPEVGDFEREFAAYCEAPRCVGTANGTDALELILLALGIGIGDEVIIPTNTFVATVEAVCAVGASPRFVDVSDETLLIDPQAAQAAITPATAALIAVHMFGQMADVVSLSRLAARHGLALIEDAAQAHGARFAGHRAGSVGDAAAFSFYPGKNLGALGDGGAVVTGSAAIAEQVASLANHGRSPGDRHRHVRRGRNSRLDSVQAAFLSIKLRRLDDDNRRRAQVFAGYRAALPDCVRCVGVADAAVPVHHLAVVRADNRARVTEALSAHGIGWGIHYPIPCHRQPAYAEFGAVLPVAERAAEEIVSLPISPTLGHDDVAHVCDVLRRV